MQISIIKSLAKEYADEVKSIRRKLHQHPELSFQEHQTAELVHQKLSEWNIEHETGVAGTGIVAYIKGLNPESKCIALRADMDALPIEEETEYEYKSQHKGVMHACGHDAHTAMLLGCAKILNEIKNEFSGTAKLIFQPGEEKLPGGAKNMIETGVLKNVENIVAQHTFPDLPCGKIGVCSGAYMASCDEINLNIKGQGGHAAKPQHCMDMVWIAAKIMTELQFRVKNYIPAKVPYLLRFGQFIASGTYNVIPNEIPIKGTFRIYDEKWRKAVVTFMKSFVKEESHYYGVEADLFIENGYPYLYNDKELKKHVKKAAAEYLGSENMLELEPLYTSEDFAWYSHQVPSFFYRIGTSNAKKGIVGKQHTPTFDIDEDCLEIGTGLMAWIALKDLETESKIYL
jgi:amidohydrolase